MGDSAHDFQKPTCEEVSGKRVFDFRKRPCAAPQRAYELERPVFFVGFMGAGKTSVARKIARRTGVPSIDMDVYIARSYGKEVREIFADIGEQGFRAVECQLLRELARGEARFISCGGGIVLAKANRKVLKDAGCTVYLKVTPEVAASRIFDLSTRPLFGDMQEAARVIALRTPLYEEVADFTVDTRDKGSGWVSREVFGLLRRHGVLRERDTTR